MNTQTSDKKELTAQINETASMLKDLMLFLDEDKVNTVPYKDSWTAAQLVRHVTKSTNGMSRAMAMAAKPAERDPGDRIGELKDTFLNFSIKFQSPDFIVPEERKYEKQTSIDELIKSFERLKESANDADLTELVENLPLGPITKLEMLHFVLYHTQRHLHQMRKICDALESKE